MDLLLRKDLNREEYVLAHSLLIFGMKKVGAEKTNKILADENTK
jgi:hypothetical protein